MLRMLFRPLQGKLWHRKLKSNSIMTFQIKLNYQTTVNQDQVIVRVDYEFKKYIDKKRLKCVFTLLTVRD